MSKLKTLTKILITSVSFILALIYSFPNLALMMGFVMAVYSHYISAFFCLVFAYNIARMVESIHDKTKKQPVEDMDKEAERIHGPGFSYTVESDKITFTFRDIQDLDGRQLERLKFMRKQFFKDKDEH